MPYLDRRTLCRRLWWLFERTFVFAESMNVRSAIAGKLVALCLSNYRVICTRLMLCDRLHPLVSATIICRSVGLHSGDHMGMCSSARITGRHRELSCLPYWTDISTNPLAIAKPMPLPKDH